MMYQKVVFKKLIDKVFFIFPPVLFTGLLIPSLFSIPYLDGNIDFVQSYDFYRGGITQYFQNWNSVHPPLKVFLVSILFRLFGVNSIAYGILGILFGSIAILFLYFLTEAVFDTKTARISSFFLATSPLFLANSIFGMRDAFAVSLLLMTLYFYAKKRLLLYSLSAICALATKETMLLLPLSVLFLETYFFIHHSYRKELIPKIFFFTLPLAAEIVWWIFLKLHHKTSWQEWIFADTRDKGTIYTILHNILTLQIFNPYALHHILQLFFLNFIWIYWVALILGVYVFIKKHGYKYSLKKLSKDRTLLALFLFSGSYAVTVLTLQIYTIPRYALALLPFLFMSSAYFLFRISSYKHIVMGMYGFIIMVSLFSSSDPVSSYLWGREKILGNSLYAVHRQFAGNDGITYNAQYLFLIQKRTQAIHAFKKHVVSSECNWILPDPNNDKKTIHILKLPLDTSKPCISRNAVRVE